MDFYGFDVILEMRFSGVIICIFGLIYKGELNAVVDEQSIRAMAQLTCGLRSIFWSVLSFPVVIH